VDAADRTAAGPRRRFWRAGASDAPSQDGAGLGLAIADSVVRLHGGSIAARNDRGGGLLVAIDLPIGMTQ
jgi:signal transduction histidine kinase